MSLITQQASAKILMVMKKLRIRISLMLSSFWLCHASQQLIGHSKFYDEPLATLLSYRANRHWHYFRVWKCHLLEEYYQELLLSSLNP